MGGALTCRIQPIRVSDPAMVQKKGSGVSEVVATLWKEGYTAITTEQMRNSLVAAAAVILWDCRGLMGLGANHVQPGRLAAAPVF